MDTSFCCWNCKIDNQEVKSSRFYFSIQHYKKPCWPSGEVIQSIFYLNYMGSSTCTYIRWMPCICNPISLNHCCFCSFSRIAVVSLNNLIRFKYLYHNNLSRYLLVKYWPVESKNVKFSIVLAFQPK